jgi:S-(hydroxymethyl)glutathione dehydrogenase/alcohol dehydrogenase
MKKKTNAFFLEKIKHKLKLKERITLPELSKGQVLVKLIYTSLCGSQIMEINGKRGKDSYLPHGLGHEGVAKVITLGPGVRRLKKGDKVILTWIKSKGHDCKGYKLNIGNKKYLNFGPITTLSNYSIISENRCVRKPKNLNDKLAAFFGCSISTGFGIVYNSISKKNRNKSIGIYGLGTVGVFSLLAAKCLNFKKIFVIEKNKSKLNLAKKLGAIIINYKKPLSDLKTINQNKLLDYCFESTGNTEAIETSINLINNKGICYISSHPNNKDKIKISPYELIKGKKIIGSWGGYTKPDKDFINYSKLLNKNFKLIKLIKIKAYKFKEINKAINDLQNNKIIKPLIKC